MHRSYKIIPLALLLIALQGCDRFLERNPIDDVADEEFFETGSQAETAMRGAYRLLSLTDYYGTAFIIIPEYAADHLRHTGDFPEFNEFTRNEIRVDNAWAFRLWRAMYQVVNTTNNIIARVPLIAEGGFAEDGARLVREAQFVRALTYFNLVRCFGRVPLLTQPTASLEAEAIRVGRSQTVDEVYDLIVADLTAAESLPDGYGSLEATKGRTTNFAAKALLARVHLYRAQYDLAAQKALEVIQGGFALTASYPAIFVDQNSSEAIFELQYNEQITNPLPELINPGATRTHFASNLAPTLFEEGDVRADFSIITLEEDDDTLFFIGKYRAFAPPSQNVPVLRLSEIFLIYAEAAARVAGSPVPEAFQYYAQIRARAGFPDETPPADLATFITLVQREKRREMIFEGEAWFDYCRTGLALTEMGVPNPDRFLFPIPQADRDLNPNLDQNPGY